MRRIGVFASGGGSNLQALIDHFNDANDAARVALVLSARAQAGALGRAAAAGVASHVVRHAGRSESDIAGEIATALESQNIDLIALAGYLRLVPQAVVRAFRGRILNIHPALLPAFGGRGMYGLHVHRAVIAARCRVSGATVHHVDERYDEGRPVLQWPVPVLPDDTPETLAARVLRIEHAIYPVAVEAIARGAKGDEPRRADSMTFALDETGGVPGVAQLRNLLDIGRDGS
jgi:phosphoribosylglycinamide formyltransferase-1